ncbi:MAG: inositol monophosphatase [Sphingomonadales bacterium]|nr:inositol monophosphatase [Sphingomonadales bacterium]
MQEQALDRAVIAVMRDAADRAIMPRYQSLSAHDIIDKDPGARLLDLVTVADKESEVILAEGLAKILPEAAIVGEEAAHADPSVLDGLGAPLCWIIDPVDGTNNFASGKPPFGILVALAAHGETIGGWIFDPLKNRLCHAHKGQGAWVDGERVTSRGSGQTPPIAAISFVFADEAERAALKAQIAPHYTTVDIPRCAAEQYPRIVLGENDLTIFSRTLAWDHAAGVLFVNEAGGKVARPDGRPYLVPEHMQNGLLGASSPALWDELAARIAGMVKG